MSRSLNRLFEDNKFVGYGLPKWSAQINHLSYANDTILFGSGDKYLVCKMMEVMTRYENISGQLINKKRASSTFTRRHLWLWG